MTTAEAQRTLALEKANVVRLTNARWKADVKAQPMSDGLAQLAKVLRTEFDDTPIGSIRLVEFLCSCRGVRRTMATRFLRKASITRTGDIPLRRLTVRERAALAFVLETRR